MVKRVTSAASYQLMVTLQDVKPAVWRRVVVPGHWHLGRVHDVLQVAMGWTDSHLHEFDLGEFSYGQPQPGWGSDVRRETLLRLHEAVPAVGSSMLYTYDFGDNWRHDIVVEALGDPVTRASCTDGRRACPPEDSGGAWGYADMLAAVDDPGHPEHETSLEWLGDNFDPEVFDVSATNARLARLG